ncbi:MAG TPA: glycosyltransferase [Planctomycetes bacterium]|nr:glycosyltransferase [Planctomycetota bacterium]
MKILACHNYYQQAGGEDLIFADEVRLLRSRGHKVVEYTLHNDSIHDMGRIELAKNTFWNRESAAKVKEIMHQERPDILHSMNTFPLISPSIFYAAKEAGVPVVQWLQNFRTICPKAQFTRNDKPCEKCLGKAFAWPALVHRCYRGSLSASTVVAGMSAFHRARKTWVKMVDRFLVPTEFVRQKHIEGGIPADRIEVKPNFVHDDPGVGTGRGGYFVFVGRLSQEKGIETLLAAWKRLPVHCRLKIVGDGPLADFVRTASANDERIEWLGWKSLDEALAIVGDALALIMPSTWYETFGRTIIEAYSKGTPVIASRLGAMAEIVRDGETGLMFEPGDDFDLAVKAEMLLLDHRLTSTMRQKARSDYEAKFTAETNYEMLISVFERTLSASGNNHIVDHRLSEVTR